jgi:MFS family permease
LICFTVYLAANIGLAFQTSYPALMVLRCLQSSGSSGTIALGSATVSDLSTRAERGKYIGYATMGVTLGPALGPVIGGLLDHFLGWRWIFLFLVILSGTFGAIIVIFYPETCRTVVGNGSVPAAKWNRSIVQIIGSKLRPNRSTEQNPNYATLQNQGKRRANPLASALIATEREPLMILIYGSLLYAGFMSIMSTLTTELQSRFGFNSIQIGLCYLPLGVGSLTSRWTVGYLLDWNFKREAARQGLAIVKNRQQEIEKFNIEVARLTITLPLVYFGALCLIAYGWVMQYKTALAGPMVMLFFMGHCTTAAFSSLNTLIVDTHRQSPATAVAANNLWRCLVGAGAIAAANPLIDRIGIGWTGSFIAFLWIIFSPILWAVYKRGHGWREASRIKRADAEALKNVEKGTN